MRQQPDFKNAIIFCNRKRDVHTVYRSLERHGFSVTALHGDLDQRARMAALESFRNGSIQLLVASDVAARGLDIPDVSHVFNYDVPHHAEDYVHRIGRTGRAGKKGVAISIVTAEDKKNLAAIEHMIGASVEWQGEVPPAGDGEGERRRRPGGRRTGGRDGAPREGGRGKRDGAREARPDGEAREPRPEREPRAERAPRPEREPRAERTPRPEREARGEREPRIEADAEAAAPRDAQPRQDRHERRDSFRGRQPAGEARIERPARPPIRRHESDDPPVVGLGDHVPSFLLRSVKRP